MDIYTSIACSEWFPIQHNARPPWCAFSLMPTWEKGILVLRAVSLDVDSFPLGYLPVILDYVSNTKTAVGNGRHIHNTLSPEMRLAPADHQNKYFVKHGVKNCSLSLV